MAMARSHGIHMTEEAVRAHYRRLGRPLPQYLSSEEVVEAALAEAARRPARKTPKFAVDDRNFPGAKSWAEVRFFIRYLEPQGFKWAEVHEASTFDIVAGRPGLVTYTPDFDFTVAGVRTLVEVKGRKRLPHQEATYVKFMVCRWALYPGYVWRWMQNTRGDKFVEKYADFD